VREQQIGRLAADGLPNREIGEHLFISHRRLRPRAGGQQVGRCQQGPSAQRARDGSSSG
jgi:hypothetical protein